MGTVSFNMFPEDELQDFTAACRKYGASVRDYLIKSEEEPLAVGVAPMRRQIILIHVPSGSVRRYEGGHGSHWVVDFEQDLAAGLLLKP